MAVLCIECEGAELRPGPVDLTGNVRGESYTVRMDGLVCPGCGYRTIEGAQMPEFARLLADQYRTAHGLLTSEQLRQRRNKLEMSQAQFADHVGVGIASVKRWEMGKIQDERSNELLLQRTAESPEEIQAHFGLIVGASAAGFFDLSEGTLSAVDPSWIVPVTVGVEFLVHHENAPRVYASNTAGCVAFLAGGRSPSSSGHGWMPKKEEGIVLHASTP